MDFIHEAAALFAAFCWSVTGLLANAPVRHLGAFTFTRYRMTVAVIIFAVLITATGRWEGLDAWMLLPTLASGFMGILLGDCALFLTQFRMGPRRTALLFATNAPMSVILGWLILGESLTFQALAGLVITFAGVMLAIAFGRGKPNLHAWEEVRGSLAVGIALGLSAAFLQSAGSLLARPVMQAGADPLMVSFIRAGTSVIGLHALSLLPFAFFKPRNPLTMPSALALSTSAIFGMGLGMTLVLYALAGGNVGIVATLSATSPAMQLPLIWLRTGERPTGTAWIGAILAVIGSGMIFMR
ncbi:MAG: hypothetical protein RIR97_929 [Pseudomonadota bacterium]